MNDVTKIAMKVPTKAKAMTVPKFLKNGFFYRLYPDSKIMGGSSKIINKLLKWVVIFELYCPILSYLKI